MPARNYGRVLSPAAVTATPQNKPIKKYAAEMSKNRAGGFAFDIKTWDRVQRFLILGSEEPTYYANSKSDIKKMIKQNIASLDAAMQQDSRRLVDLIVKVSTEGRAAKVDPAIFALAFVCKHAEPHERAYAYSKLSTVCRTATHLFQFIEAVDAMGKGWGTGMVNAVADWYLSKTPADVAFQGVKYRSRNGYTHRDVLRLSHPYTNEHARHQAFRWLLGKDDGPERIQFPIIVGFEAVQKAKTPKQVAALIREYKLPREAVPTEFVAADPKNAPVWEALLETMPATALVRNLANLTRAGVVKELSTGSTFVAQHLEDDAFLKKGRVHPMNVLLASYTYASGKGQRGSGTWTPVQRITAALDVAFRKSFQNVERISTPTVIAVDVSGSMFGSWYGGGSVAGIDGLDAATAAAAQAIVLAACCDNWSLLQFDTDAKPMTITPTTTIASLVQYMLSVQGGGTDCSAPYRYLERNNIAAHAVVTLTDNETWAGYRHPQQALESYRKRLNYPVAAVNVAFVASGHSINRPNDERSLDIVGFDTAAPVLLGDFLANV